MIADIHAQMAVITGVIDVSESFVIERFNASCMPILVYSIDARARERGMVELPFDKSSFSIAEERCCSWSLGEIGIELRARPVERPCKYFISANIKRD